MVNQNRTTLLAGAYRATPASDAQAVCVDGSEPWARSHGGHGTSKRSADCGVEGAHRQNAAARQGAWRCFPVCVWCNATQLHLSVEPLSLLACNLPQRDARTTKLLLAHGANEDLPFLLDMWPPKADSLFATKASKADCLVAHLPGSACRLHCLFGFPHFRQLGVVWIVWQPACFMPSWP